MEERLTVDDLVRCLRSLLLLKILNDTMRIQRVGNRASKLVVDACGLTIRRHQRDVHVHLLLRVSIFRLLIPVMFVFAFLGRLGSQLVGEILDDEGGTLGVIALPESTKGCRVSGGQN